MWVKNRLNFAILIWTLVALLPSASALAQVDSTGNWRIHHHEPLRLTEVKRPQLESRVFEDGASGAAEGLSFEAFGRLFELNLESNDQLIADLDAHQRKRMGTDFRLYRGSVVGAEGSWLRLSQSRGRWSGVIWDGVELFFVDPADAVMAAVGAGTSSRAGDNIIYRESDTEDESPVHCGLESADGETDELNRSFGDLRRHLESAEPLIARAISAEALELVVVADAEFVAENGANTAFAVTSRINVVDGIFDSQVGVALSLVEIVELNSNGSLSSTNAGQLLDQFSDLSFSGEIDNPGLAHLFTGRNLDGTTAGVAYLRSICRVSSGVGLSETRGSGTRGAITVAHEIGHNFGAPHDNQNGSACAATPSGFLMNPSLNFGGDTFSQCSLDQIAPIVANAECLVPVPEPEWVELVALGVFGLVLLRGRCPRRFENVRAPRPC